MPTLTTGRPLGEDGEPIDGPALELDPDGPAAALFRETPHALASSPGAGLWYALLDAPDESDGVPALLVWLAPDAMVMPAHVHARAAESFHVLDGHLTVVVEGDPLRLGPGERVTVDPGEEHAFRNDTDDYVAFRADLPWRATAETQLTVCGLDHEGAFASGEDRFGEPGPLHGLVMSEYLSDGTRVTALPTVLQRLLWATVGRVARAAGHAAVEERYLRDEFWRRHVEQPTLERERVGDA
jgi:quercetin dioxygenase-like cupin family protein